ncbi:unnamed protein product [Sphenostylis stenocarpa]|uniref:Uncharacterized protein n=1 Tax=Sphenostylis stenocarpa TaxID=92480 RepID=A0AA86SPV0_9FABA|nr:unnamed protein product [Sphenostylis stenocarpa]
MRWVAIYIERIKGFEHKIPSAKAVADITFTRILQGLVGGPELHANRPVSIRPLCAKVQTKGGLSSVRATVCSMDWSPCPSFRIPKGCYCREQCNVVKATWKGTGSSRCSENAS